MIVAAAAADIAQLVTAISGVLLGAGALLYQWITRADTRKEKKAKADTESRAVAVVELEAAVEAIGGDNTRLRAENGNLMRDNARQATEMAEQYRKIRELERTIERMGSDT